MNWKRQLLWLAIFVGVFAGFYWLPVGEPPADASRGVRGLYESVLLAKWYAREHVLLCLVPAFFIAGGIGVFVSQASVMRYLGTRANKVVAYGVASVSGTILAVCSCTVLPLFAGIYRDGEGSGARAAPGGPGAFAPQHAGPPQRDGDEEDRGLRAARRRDGDDLGDRFRFDMGLSKGGRAMSDCCGKDAGKKKNVLLYACSGGANVAEVADRAARQLMFDGCGTMFCLAGLGAGIQGMIQTAKDADLNVVLDGCPMDCAKKIFDKVGLTNYVQIKVTDLGMEKTKGVRATDSQVAKLVAEAKKALAEV
jgi:uncharacterized metal-binding protein